MKDIDPAKKGLWKGFREEPDRKSKRKGARPRLVLNKKTGEPLGILWSDQFNKGIKNALIDKWDPSASPDNLVARSVDSLKHG